MKQHKKALALWIGSVLVLLVGALLAGSPGRTETVQEAMRDAVLHSVNRISLLGLKTVNPGMISAFVVTAALLLAAALIRVFVIPRFRYVPGKFQLVLEEAVGLFDRMSRGDSPHRCKFLGAYALGTLSYLVILSGGIAGNGVKGVGKTLKEFSLPISMSFRLFGALLSGLLVTELVYYYISLSFVLPVLVGVLFTLLHALVQTYVLTMLVSMYYGEVSEPGEAKQKKIHTAQT